MRIISGKYRGRKLQGFNIEGTRPTIDRIKESVFAMIQTKIENSKCLDLFAGSGALGLEAISMGAKMCDFVDHNEIAIKTIKKNAESIEEEINIINSDYKKYLKQTKEKYDIIFLDPPYNHNLLNKALKYIEEYNVLRDGGIVVCEFENESPITNLKILKERNYGSKKIKIFEK